MKKQIDLPYAFHTTGGLQAPAAGDRGSDFPPLYRLFGKVLASVKHLGLHAEPLAGATVDFRLVFDPGTSTPRPAHLRSLLTFSFKLAEEVSHEDVASTTRSLVDYCESLLTFTFREYNFTVERSDGPATLSSPLAYILEILRALDMPNPRAKVAPEQLKAPLAVRKLGNLLVRFGKPIGFALTADLHGFAEGERAILLQAGLHGQDPLSKLAEHLALPSEQFSIAPSIEQDAGSDAVLKPVCKIRLFSSVEPSSFYVSELLECVSPSFPRTVKRTIDPASQQANALFSAEADELRLFSVTGDSPVDFSPQLQPLMRKLYRSLGVDEIAHAAPFPREPIPGILHKQYTTFVPPISDLSPRGIVLGTVRTEASAGLSEVRIDMRDRLRHLYVLGKTGTGKSSFLSSTIIQDLVDGRGALVLDPHGDLCDDLVAAIPEPSLDDVVLIDPTLSPQLPGCSLNPLDVGGAAVSAERLSEMKDYWTSELTAMFLSLYGGETFGPRIQEYFRAACLTLMEPRIRGTLADVPRLFTDDAYRQECRGQLEDPYAKDFWATFDATGSHERQEMVPYFSSKFAPLVRSHFIRSFLGQSKSGLDLEGYLDTGKTVLVRLSKGRLGEIGMRLIGMLLLARIKALIFARQSVEAARRRPVVLWVDEFQNFVFEGFTTLLSEARKYGLGLVLAHQYLDQMSHAHFQLANVSSDSGLLQAILGNVGSLAIFRVGAEDAQRIVAHIGDPVQPKDLTNLENFEFVGRILKDGVLSAPLSARSFRHPLLDNPVPREEFVARIDYLLERFRAGTEVAV